MPRPDKGPRLYLKRLKGRTPMWVIRHGSHEESTGCAYPDAGEERFKKFEEYTARTFRPNTGQRDLNKIACVEVLMLYLSDMPEDSPTKRTAEYHVANLKRYWNDKHLSDVKGSTCREYIQTRCGRQWNSVSSDGSQHRQVPRGAVKPSTARQELKTFQAAINHWHKESPLVAVPKVTLPKPGERRERVLERHEVAAMLWACRRLSREEHVMGNMGKLKFDYSHVARFILIGLYTGTRHDAILGLRWAPHSSGGNIDLQRGVLFRRGVDERETSKRRPPVQIGGPLGGHCARWLRKDAKGRIPFVVHYNGERILKMKKAWATVRKAAGLGPEVTPHVLRHTCCSWHLWDGKTIWEVAGIIGADASTVSKVYGHHKIDGKVRGFER